MTAMNTTQPTLACDDLHRSGHSGRNELFPCVSPNLTRRLMTPRERQAGQPTSERSDSKQTNKRTHRTRQDT